MRFLRVAVLVLMALAASRALHAQLNNPIPAPIPKRGLRVEIKDVVRMPDTRGLRGASEDSMPAGWARLNFVRELPDGRRFVNDLRGLLYVLDAQNRPTVYADTGAAFPLGYYRGLVAGFVTFEFHPEFAANGLFYTIHTERATGNPGTLHFIPPGFAATDVTYHTVITEWQAASPSANVFKGSRRELLRVGHVVANPFHPLDELKFNPLARPGAPDYGLLYVGSGDWGFSNGGGPKADNPGQGQRTDTLLGAVLRVDPRSPSVSGGTRGIGNYTIPAINKFAADGDPKTFGEIYAYGFRNPHRLSWDPSDGTLFVSDIGNSNIEEINIVREGNNHGWMQREGIFQSGYYVSGGNGNQVYPLPPNVLDGTMKDGFTYPVAMYDHGEGLSVSAGVVYSGRIPALKGKFIFGDIARGRVFAADVAALKAADDGIPSTVAGFEEIQLFVRDATGTMTDVSLQQLVDKLMGPRPRVDLQLSQAANGELYLTSRQDGMIRTLGPDQGAAVSSAR
jgi:Glucose / Sorbosone dehydrogenase